MSAGPELSVVIPSFGSYGTLARVLDGYGRQSAGPGAFEVVVVVDAADPHPERVDEALERRPYPVCRVDGPVPGASANRNAGVGASQAPVVLFTDNDTVPTPGLVDEHLGWHRRFPADAVAVQGPVRWARELEVTTFMRWLDTGIQFDFDAIEGIEAGWGRFISANVSVKRSFADLVGGFDEVNFPYGYEDTDWAYRANGLGLRLVYNRRAVVEHLRPMSLEFWQARARRIAASEATFVRLHPELRPWFHDLFEWAAAQPKAEGRGLRWGPYVSPRLPVLGPRVWRSIDRYFKQAIAPHFLAAWQEAARNPGQGRAPDLSEFDVG